MRTPAISGPRPLTKLQPDGGIAGPLHRVVITLETKEDGVEAMFWQSMTLLLALVLVLLYGDAQYWRGKAMTLDKERSDSGWEDEAKFWRKHFDAESAEWVEAL